MMDTKAEKQREELPKTTRQLKVADNGMDDCPDDNQNDVDEHHQLRDGVVLIGGEARFRHVYCAGGAVPDVAATWTESLGSSALVLTRDEAMARGWFGVADPAVLPAVLPRIGDVVVACRGTHGIFSSVDFPYETRLVGVHGSLTPDEMNIPLLIC
jgi:hypothetical protein